MREKFDEILIIRCLYSTQAVDGMHRQILPREGQPTSSLPSLHSREPLQRAALVTQLLPKKVEHCISPGAQDSGAGSEQAEPTKATQTSN